LRQAKGFRGRAKNCFTIAIRRLQKSWQYAYRDRKVKKREWRSLWITRLNSGARQYDISYSKLIPTLEASNIQLNRKVLSEIAAMEPFSFKAVLDVTKAMMSKAKISKEQE
jgi:large subunit ribosomal protein L20